MKFNKYLVVMVVLMAVGLVVSCKWLKREASKTPTGVKSLKTTFLSPTGETDNPLGIVVSFDAPMVALSNIGNMEKVGPIQITPAVDGHYKWLGTKTVMFVPDKLLPYGTAFEARVSADTLDINGNGLAEEVKWAFETARSDIVRSIPKENATDIDVKDSILIVFNQPVKEGTVSEHTKITAQTKEAGDVDVAFDVGRPAKDKWKKRDGDINRAVVLTPKKAMPSSANVEVVVDEKMTGVEGVLEAKSPLSVRFRTYETFDVEGLNCTMNCDPRGGNSIKFVNSVLRREAAKYIDITPPVELTPPSYDSPSQYLWLDGVFKSNTKYEVTILPDITDVHGNKLGKQLSLVFTTANIKPSISFVTGFGVLETDGPPKEIGVSTINVSRLDFAAGLIGKEDIVANTGPDSIYNNSPLPKTLVTYTKSFDVKKTVDKEIVTPVSINPVLDEKKGGVVLVDVSSPEVTYVDEKKEVPYHQRSILQISDIGITAKIYDGGAVIWTTSLSKGTPIGAEIELRNASNKVVASGSADENGITRLKLPTKKLIEEVSEGDEDRLIIIATYGDDLAFSTKEWTKGIEPWDFDLWQEESRNNLRAFVFTERGIYKPGETIHAKAIVRRLLDKGMSIPKDMKPSFVASDSRGKEYFKGPVKFNEFGSVSVDVEIPKYVDAGYHNIKLVVADKDEKEAGIFQTSVQVMQYRPAEFKVVVATDKDTIVAGDDVKVNISSTYLFGEPVKKASLETDVFYGADSFSSEKFSEYSFGRIRFDNDLSDEEWQDEYNKLVSKEETVLNEAGKKDVVVPVKQGSLRDVTNISIEATVRDVNDQAITGRKELRAFPAEYILGLKVPSSIIKAKEPFGVSLVAINQKEETVADKKVVVKLLKREWQAVKKKEVVGYTFETKPVDLDVGECTVKTTAEVASCNLTAKLGGVHIVKAISTDGRGNTTESDMWVYAEGAGEAGWKPEASDRVTLVPDKKEYAPGDKAKILIQSPFNEAYALITNERNQVVNQKISKLVGNTPTIEVPITDAAIPNLFVSVVLIKGRIANDSEKCKGDPSLKCGFDQIEWGKDEGRPRVKVGYLNLPVIATSKKLVVEVVPDKKQAGPGDELQLKINVKDSKGAGIKSEVAVMAVDAGSLLLTGFTTPDPYDVLYAKMGLGVTTTDTRLYVVGRRRFGEKGEDAGGGGVGGFLGRSKFLTVPYWNPFVVTDENGEATVSFKLPDNLTTFKIMAVADTPDKFGSADSEVVSTKQVMLRPLLPFFAYAGDKIDAGVVVQNNSKEDVKGSVFVTAEGVSIAGDATKGFEVKAGDKKEVFFTFETKLPTNAILDFTAKGAVVLDAIRLPIVVKPVTTNEVVITTGETKDRATEKIGPLEKVYPAIGGLTVGVSSSLLTNFKDSMLALVDYPYECLEQKISRILGMISYSSIVATGDEDKGPDWKKKIEASLDALYRFQDWSGGFSVWPKLRTSPYLSSYALQVMLKARGLGYKVDDELLDKTVGFLKEVLKWTEKGSGIEATRLMELKAYALYALSLAGEYDAAYAQKIYESRKDLSPDAYIRLTLAMQQNKLTPIERQEFLDFVANNLVLETETAHIKFGKKYLEVYQNDLVTNADLLEALLKIQPDHPHLRGIVKYIMQAKKRDMWVSTYTTATVLSLLDDYVKAKESGNVDFKAKVALGTKDLIEAKFEGLDLREEQKTEPIDEITKLQTPTDLEFSKDGEGTLYYRVRLEYAPDVFPIPPMDEGFVISKEFKHFESDKVDTEFVRGEPVKVALYIVNPIERRSVVIEDQLPVGIEAVSFSLDTAQRRLAINSGAKFSIEHVETDSNKVLVFANYLPAGTYKFEYVAKATTKGDYIVPPAKIEAMYSNDIFGRSGSGKVVVK